MSDDRELIELAAKAAGYQIHDWFYENRAWAYPAGAEVDWQGELLIFQWAPLLDDGDALRLAVDLDLQRVFRGGVEHASFCFMERDEDPYAATRRAIVRAAAEIGRALP